MEIVPQLVATDLTLNKPSLEILLSCLATQCHVHGQRKAYRLWLRESIMIIVNLALCSDKASVLIKEMTRLYFNSVTLLVTLSNTH